MAKKSKQRKMKSLLQQVCHPDAAGIDIGAEEFYVAVGKEKINPAGGESPVRSFSSFNTGIAAAIEWLKGHNIKTVAMESTGNYWVALFDQLQQNGLEVCLTNASHCKALPGRKTDICDAQWIEQLHTAGLLRSSYVLEEDFRAIRYLMRYRDSLIKEGARNIQLMQKAFTQMNVQLHHAVSDIDGWSGRQIIEAILAGERDPEALADLRHPNCRTPRKTVIEALSGNYRNEYLFVLRMNYERWKSVRRQIYEIEAELAGLLEQCPAAETSGPAAIDLSETGSGIEIGPGAESSPQEAGHTPQPHIHYQLDMEKSKRKNEPGVCFRSEAMRIYGVDLSGIPSIADGVIANILAEIGGKDQFLTSFTSARKFVSWLGKCPDNRITGGRVKSSKTRKVNNPLAVSLRMAAMTLWRSDNYLGEYCRKMKARLGNAEGITATSHKLARIIYAMISTGKPYDPEIGETASEKSLDRQLKALEKKARRLGVTLDTSNLNATRA
jgi:transposase